MRLVFIFARGLSLTDERHKRAEEGSKVFLDSCDYQTNDAELGFRRFTETTWLTSSPAFLNHHDCECHLKSVIKKTLGTVDTIWTVIVPALFDGCPKQTRIVSTPHSTL